jgi:PST family polysaccharide transporter
MASLLIALPSIIYAGRPIGIGAALVVRAVGPQLIGAISTAAAGWWLQTALLSDYSGFVRIVLSGGFCAGIYLAMVVGLFRLREPIRVASAIVKDLIGRR